MKFDIRQEIEAHVKGARAIIEGPDGKEIAVYFRRMDGNTDFDVEVDRLLEIEKRAKLEELGSERVKKYLEGGNTGLMELNLFAGSSRAEKEKAQRTAMNGRVLLGWEADDFPCRHDDGTYHSENGAELLKIDWIYLGLMKLSGKQSALDRLMEEIVEKKLLEPSTGTSDGEKTSPPSKPTTSKPKSFTRRGKKPR
jgi:hypothetical protein